MQNESIPTDLQNEINKLQAMQVELTKTSQDRDDIVQKRQKENSAANAELLALQIESAESGKLRQKLFNRLLMTAVTVLTAGASTGAYYATVPSTAAEAVEEAKPVLDVIKTGDKGLEQQIQKNKKRAERLRDMALEQQVQIADNGDYTRLLIRAAHPKLDETKIKIPDSIPKARKKAKAIKRAKRDKKVKMWDLSVVDPFAGIEDEDKDKGDS